MSFRKYKKIIEDGDTVILYLSITSTYAIVLKGGDVFQTKYGALKHDEIIGKEFGSLVNCSKGWAYVLHPTPELWTITLPHRTQILYSTDISVITLQLDLKPGDIVCEAGTGSGSLSHAILRTIAPNGHLNTFDFHELRVQKAAEEFEEHGLKDLVTARHRDVVTDGLGLEDVADAVFLDLPLPWKVVPSAVKAIKKSGGRICSFSPCIEQVQKTCEALTDSGCHDITTIECLLRPYEVRYITIPTLATTPIQSIKESTSTGASAENLVVAPMEIQENEEKIEVKREEEEEKISTEKDEDEKEVESKIEAKIEAKRGKHDERKERMKSWKKRKTTKKETRIQEGPHRNFVTAFPKINIPGHTGYLTFASVFSK